MARLHERVALITGATGGIGRATATLFLAEGARLLLVDLDAAALATTARELAEATGPGAGARIATQAADVGDEAAMAGAIAAAVTRFGRLDVLFCNAGIEGPVGPISALSVADFDRVLAVNVRGVFLGLKHAMPVMARQGGGSIVITSSVAGLRGAARLPAYAASKHAVVGLMRSAALEAGDSGVRVNTIHPAPIETRMMRSIEEGQAPGAAQAAKARITTRIPVGRYGQPDEVARVALFLASDDSRYCTGGTYAVDGGMTAG